MAIRVDVDIINIPIQSIFFGSMNNIDFEQQLFEFSLLLDISSILESIKQ